MSPLLIKSTPIFPVKNGEIISLILSISSWVICLRFFFRYKLLNNSVRIGVAISALSPLLIILSSMLSIFVLPLLHLGFMVG